MRYFLIFGLYKNDTYGIWADRFVVKQEAFPTDAELEEIGIGRQFAEFKGITGMCELSEEDAKTWLKD